MNFTSLVDRLSDDEVCIFLFHGVVEEHIHTVRNYNRKHVDKALFEKFLISLLAVGGCPLSMDNVLEHLINREPFPKKSFAVTFDDGFQNNLTTAAPILNNMNIPFTIYLTSDFVRYNKMSWIDKIDSAVAQIDSRFEYQFPNNSKVYCVDKTQESKITFLEVVRHYVKHNKNADPLDFAEQFISHFGFNESQLFDDALDSKISLDALNSISRDDGIILGGHSKSHRIMAHLEPAELELEVNDSMRLGHQVLGRAFEHFAYPEGLSHCYSGKVIDVLKREGVKCCPTAIDGRNDCFADPFELRRISVML